MTGFRVEIELADRSVHSFDGIPAQDAQEIIRMFTNCERDGLTFVQNSTCNVFFWPWEDILSCKVVRP